jgi:hypothetical protein
LHETDAGGVEFEFFGVGFEDRGFAGSEGAVERAGGGVGAEAGFDDLGLVERGAGGLVPGGT